MADPSPALRTQDDRACHAEERSICCGVGIINAYFSNMFIGYHNGRSFSRLAGSG